MLILFFHFSFYWRLPFSHKSSIVSYIMSSIIVYKCGLNVVNVTGRQLHELM